MQPGGHNRDTFMHWHERATMSSHRKIEYFLVANFGSVEMWKYVFIVLIDLVTLEVWKCWNVEICLPCLCLKTLEVWKCGNVEICLHCLWLITLEVWKCGNMSSLSLSQNSGNVEMFLHCLYLLTPEVWKCGEICLNCLYPITPEVWKTGNLEMCLVCFNLI